MLTKLAGLTQPVAIHTILYLRADANYTWVYYAQQPKCLLAATLKRLETQLPSFVRIHHSWLINPIHIAQIGSPRNRTMRIVMTNGESLPVSRRRIDLVCQQLVAPSEY